MKLRQSQRIKDTSSHETHLSSPKTQYVLWAWISTLTSLNALNWLINALCIEGGPGRASPVGPEEATFPASVSSTTDSCKMTWSLQLAPLCRSFRIPFCQCTLMHPAYMFDWVTLPVTFTEIATSEQINITEVIIMRRILYLNSMWTHESKN